MLYHPTIVDGGKQIDGIIDSSDDEMDEGVTVIKKKVKSCMDFADEFTFDDGARDHNVDELKSIRPYMRKSLINSLQEKIDRERAENVVDTGSDNSMVKAFEIVQEKEEIADHLREKRQRIQKKIDSNATNRGSSADQRFSLTFEQMSISRPLLKAITVCGYNEPTPIQSASIPVALAGRDICACAATGTGKTVAFMLPILERLIFRPQREARTSVIVMVPTRELAIQVFQVSRKLSQFMHVEVCLCAGGLDLKAQEAALRLQPDIVIATPGRLIDHLHNTPNFSLNDIEILVLDEADRMLDEAFSDQIKEIIRLCAANRQTLLFSATMTDEVENLAAVSLKDPVKLFINENTETALNLRQEFVRIRENREEDRECIVCALVTRNFPSHTIVFVQTKKICQRLHIVLGLLGIKVGQLHSSLSQSQRIDTMHRFKKAELDVLVSTDLAARGIDIEGVLTVINMNMPVSLKQYVHRVGRTARAGRVGRSISLVGENERKLLKEIVASNKGSALKQRQISADVVDAYKIRIVGLKESIEKIEEEERAERGMRLAQEEISRGESTLDGENQKRKWMTTNVASSKKEKMKMKNKKKGSNLKETDEEINIRRIADSQVRAAKRARRGKKIRAVVESTDLPKKMKQKKKSSFTSELTSIDKHAVKRFRKGPTDSDFKKQKFAKLGKRRK